MKDRVLHVTDFGLTEQEVKLIKICLEDSRNAYENNISTVMTREEANSNPSDPDYQIDTIEGSQQIISMISKILSKLDLVT
jgi:hypothetical protein